MTTDYPRLPSTVAIPDRVGQGTLIEASRAATQVQAAVIMAKQFPRDENMARAKILRACANPGLAENAFYSVPRGDKIARNGSIHLARELARIWGNTDFGVVELRRDDVHGQSEMQAYCWDLETNTRVAAIFIVPHRRDLSGGKSKPLASMSEIYETNANAGARRLRECIRTVIPRHIFDEAEAACDATLKAPKDDKGVEVPLAVRIERILANYTSLGVDQAQLEKRFGKARADWTPDEALQLWTLGRSIQNGETTVAEAFPQERVSVDSLPPAPVAPPVAPQPPAVEDQAPVEPPAPEESGHAEAPAPEEEHALARPNQLTAVQGKLRKLGVLGAAVQQDLTTLLRRPVNTPRYIREAEVDPLLADLQRCLDDQEPGPAYDALLGARKDEAAES